jgi:hypothetical protein
MSTSTGYYISKYGGFLRVRGYGFSLTCSRPLFSERNGHRKPLLKVGAWRVFVLTPNT